MFKKLIFKIKRKFLDFKYKFAVNQIKKQMKLDELDEVETEDEILELAINLTSNKI